MKTHEISFNSRAELERQVKAFYEQHSRAKLDETQINGALTRATKMDNDGNDVGERVTVEIDYTETPI